MEPLPTGFYPFWFWNDCITTDEIKWQVTEMAAQGVRGFFIHPRQGLKDPPYLSDAFFERVSDAVATARQHGLVVHLYDEYPYPSGVAGGLVTLGEPATLATELVQPSWDLDGGPVRLELPAGKVLSALAFPISSAGVRWEQPLDLSTSVGSVLVEDSYQETGLTRYNQKRYFSGKPRPVLQATLPIGRWRLIASLQRVVQGHKYWDHFADVLNPEAVRRFIALTHERYLKRLGQEFGRTIRWIFTDEVVPGWSGGLPAAFQKEYGYDLLPLLPALKDASHPQHRQVSVDLHRLKLNLFIQSFEKPVSVWCRRHQLAYAAEKPSLRFNQLRYQDIPGCEPGHVKAGGILDLLQPSLRGNARATASAAYFYGKDGALDECYHSLGWSGTLEDVRWMADAQLLLGIRYLVPHGFFYSTHNLRKHDAPPSLFFQAPYWPLFHHLVERVERIGRELDGSYINARLVVVDPTAGLPTLADRADYERLLQLLMANHLDFHIVDTDVLEEGRLEHGKAILRDLAIEAVLVPPMTHIEAPLAAWLSHFADSGGKVVICPSGFASEELVSQLMGILQPSLSLSSGGKENSTLWCVQRCRRERTVWMVLNTSGQRQDVKLSAAYGLRELPLEDRAFPRLEQRNGDTWRDFLPFEACLLEAVEATETQPLLPAVRISLCTPMEIRTLSPNLARLYDWQLSLLDEQGAAYQTANVQAVPLANQLEQGGFRITPRFERVFGTPPQLAWPELSLRYECSFVNQYPGEVELVMEPGSIVGEWLIRVNGGPPLRSPDFKPTTAHVRGSLGTAIGSMLHGGENKISVEIRTAQPDGGLLNPLYLAGDFGLTLRPMYLTERQAEGQFEQYKTNGLPFFAGVIEYRFFAQIEELPEVGQLRLELETPKPFHEACEISLNEGAWHALPWGLYPLEIDRSELRRGENTVKIKVYSTLIRAFEGQEFDYENHRYIQL